MSSILDAPEFPLADPDGRRLLELLSRLHPTPDGANLAAAKAGFKRRFTLADPEHLWAAVLTEGASQGLNRALARVVLDGLGPRSPHRPFLDGLLAGVPVPADPEPRNADGSPAFRVGSDAVGGPEALLYHDDLTIEVGRLPALIDTLRRLGEQAPAVCRLTADFPEGVGTGTGFRVGPDLLLTNWHVVHHERTKRRARAVTAEFGYEDDGRGHSLQAVPVQCDIAGVIADEADDWAVLRATEPLRDVWPVIRLRDAARPAVEAPAYVIQHPLGNRKRVGFVRNTVTWFDDRVVHYLTDTQPGSSGSPVFDAGGRLIALHHAGGRPQTVVGMPPLAKNEGIRIERIVAGLSKQGVEVQ